MTITQEKPQIEAKKEFKGPMFNPSKELAELINQAIQNNDGKPIQGTMQIEVTAVNVDPVVGKQNKKGNDQTAKSLITVTFCGFKTKTTVYDTLTEVNAKIRGEVVEYGEDTYSYFFDTLGINNYRAKKQS
jgi:hypothetical protein